MARELLTLQFGAYSNLVGAHLWNAQEATFAYGEDAPLPEVLHDCLFRVGEAAGAQPTYTPRALIFEGKYNLGALRVRGLLYDTADGGAEAAMWPGATKVVQAEAQTKSKYVQARHQSELEGTPLHQTQAYEEDDFRSWTDVLGPHLHPRTVVPCELSQDDRPYKLFAAGENLAKDHAFRDDLETRTHFFMEECDHSQGLQIFADCATAYGGIATATLEAFLDDYGRTSAVVFASMPSAAPGADMQLPFFNAAQTLTKMLALGATVVPCCVGPSWQPLHNPAAFKHATRDPVGSPYRESGVLAAAIDTVTMCYRMRASPFAMSDLLANVRSPNSRLVALDAAFPLPVTPARPLSALLQELGPASLVPAALSPRAATGNIGTAVTVVRGVSGTLLVPPPSVRAEMRTHHPLERYDHAATMLLRHMADLGLRGRQVFSAEVGFPARPPFPPLLDAADAPIAAQLSSSTAVTAGLAPLARNLAGISSAQLASYNVPRDDFGELREALSALLSCEDSDDL